MAPPLRLLVGLLPFVLIALTILFFARTGDPMAFAFGGILASVYLLSYFLVLRRRRRAGR